MIKINHLLNSIATAFHFTHGRNGTLLRLPLLGLWLALKPFGNCFAPAIILKPYKITRNGRIICKNADGSIMKDAAGKPMWKGGEHAYEVQACSLTIRTSGLCETNFFWYGRLSFGWSSDHIALKYGKFIDTDFGGMWQYSGWLGTHSRL